MVDFAEFRIGSKVAVVDEIEWDIHRHPFLVDLKIESSTDEEKWPIDSTMLLSVKLEEDKSFSFILKCPIELQPNREATRKAAFKLEQIIMN